MSTTQDLRGEAGRASFITGDVFDVLATIEDGSVDLVLTSPPFLALRSYLPADHPDKHREIGAEPDPASFLATLLALTAEWRRVLAPHGSICVELGDTYSGSGGAGGDYNADGLRDGQQKFDGSNHRRGKIVDHNSGRRNPGAGWPLPKSLCGIPHLYHLSLAYGRNLLTGEPCEPWRVRNVVAWCRPNPPVGALGDKFRPATSYLTIACPSGSRYFDLDAVRHANPRADEEPGGYRMVGGKPSHDAGPRSQNPNGAPPLDWWEIPTTPYSGAHYAAFPPALLERPIKSMAPAKVCTVCGEPSRRIVEKSPVGVSKRGLQTSRQLGGGRADGSAGWESVATSTLGWTDCGHGSYACSTCKVVVPSDHALRRSREGQGSQAPVGGDEVLGESGEVQGLEADDAGHLRAVRDRVPGQAGGEVLHPELFGQAGARGGPDEQHHRPGAGLPHMEGGPEGHPERLRAGVGPCGHDGEAEERLHDGAPAGDAGEHRAPTGAVGDRPSPQRGQGRQSDSEPGDRDAGEARGHGDVPALPGDLPGQLGAYVCPCGGRDIEYVADHWRPGIVLDPFGGSGTTLAVATGRGHHAIGIDLDPRNVDLARDRVGPMFLDEFTLDQWKNRSEVPS